MRLRALLFASVVTGTLAFACGEDDAKPPVADSAGTGGSNNGGQVTGSAGSDGGTGSDAGVCSSLTVGTAQVDQNNQNDTLPAGTGGTVVNGVYDLVTDDKYIGLSGVAGPTGIGIKSTISITDSAFERVETQVSSALVSSSTNESGTLSVSGANGVIALTCPFGTTTTFSYTAGANGTSIVFYDATTNEGRTYQLR